MKTKKIPPAASLLLPFLLSAFLFALPVHAQNQTDFISIDCGVIKGGNYSDTSTGINYVSDATFIDSGIGESHQISSALRTSSLAQQYVNLRSFPDGNRSCYTIQLSPSSVKFLIRASFMYGNYDGLNKLPQFDLQLGVETWETVQFPNASSIVRKEIVHIPGSNYTYICLVNTGLGTPFISAIEIRPLKNDTYVTQNGSLSLYLRLNCGSSSLTDEARYPDDVYDRIWSNDSNLTWDAMGTVNTSLTVDKDKYTNFRPPSKVMSTAVTQQKATTPIQFYWDPADPTTQYYIYMHFAEVESLAANQTRQFNITLNGTLWYGNLKPDYLYTTTVYSTIPKSAPRMNFSLVETENSTLPPLLNAIEVYAVKQFLQSPTGQDEVDAMNNIKTLYGMKRNWQGDPCAPKDFAWTGLSCSYKDYEPPHIISLNLSNSELTGEIPSYIRNLQAIQTLDLSNNALNGTIPDFLAQLPSLHLLNLKGNKFTGPIPTALLQKSESGSLTLSVDQTSSKKSTSIVVPVVAGVVGGLVFIILLTLLIWWLMIRKQKKAGEVETTKNSYLAAAYNNDNDESIIIENKNRQFTYSEVLKMTNNFEHIIGRGGFGSVFLGNVNATQVAVKMLSMSSVDGFKQFRAEVRILMRVHHRNLTSLVGYCDEGDHKALIYEYMNNGNLQEQIRDTSPTVLSWEDRLRIAVDAAQGLEYLHNGCKPPIVHRDVKSTNILLSETFQAKIADFGLSRVFPTEGGTHVSTVVAGTPGYLDPEYYVSNRLNEKSDIFSFGVVILEIITSRSVILRDQENGHISRWVAHMLESEGNVERIVDGRLNGSFDVNSAWKALELAMACVSSTSSQRPTMAQIVVELKDCLAMEMAGTNAYSSRAPISSTTDTIEMASLNTDTSVLPLAR